MNDNHDQQMKHTAGVSRHCQHTMPTQLQQSENDYGEDIDGACGQFEAQLHSLEVSSLPSTLGWPFGR